MISKPRFLFVLGLLIPSLDAPASTPAQHGIPELGQTAKLIVEKANEFRRKQGLAGGAISPQLADAAGYYANYLAKTDEFSHTADDKQPGQRAKEHGYNYCLISENIAYEEDPAGFTAAALAGKFVEGWKQSPEHRKNMLEPDVIDTGVAVARSEKTGKYYAVEMFGRPHSKSIQFAISNKSDATIEYLTADRKFSLSPGYTRTHEECRSSDVTFLLPGGENTKGQTKTVKPSSGDRFVIVDVQRQLRVETIKQQASR